MKISRWLQVWLVILVASLLVASCTQRETDIGREALQSAPVDTFLVIQGTGTNGIEWHPNISNGRGTTLQVGDAGGYFAFSAMRFNPAAALPESSRVDCMVVHLNMSVFNDRSRIWPESGASDLQVRIREIRERWTEDSLLAGYLPGRETYPIIDSLLLPMSQATYSFIVPESLWSHWIAQDSTSWGLLIEPRSSGTLYGFYSSEESDTSGSLGPMLEMYGVQRILRDSVWTDTTLFIRQAAVHDAYLATSSVVLDSTRLAISQGFPQRAALYFPLNTLIIPSDTVISPSDTIIVPPDTIGFTGVVNHAELQFWADTSNSANLLYSNVGLLYKDGTMANRNWLTEADSARAGLVAISSSSFNSTNEYIEFDVSATVAYWVANPDSNTGFQILTTEENGHLTRQLFHSPLSEDSTKRPRLKIWLTEQQ